MAGLRRKCCGVCCGKRICRCYACVFVVFLALAVKNFQEDGWYFNASALLVALAVTTLRGEVPDSTFGRPIYDAKVLFYDDALMAKTQAAHAHRHSNYHYPQGRGKQGNYGNSPYKVGVNLSSTPPTWYWPERDKQYESMPWGVLIDDERNMYLSAIDGLRKFSPSGEMLWFHSTLPDYHMNNGALYKGAMYNTDDAGHVKAVSMDTGELLWKTKMSESVGHNNGFTTVHDGIVVTQADANPGVDPNYQIRALNATNGRPLWVFKPDRPVWNFKASFPGDGTFVFQDVEGKAYRCRLADGSLIWKSGGQYRTWTDATGTLGPDNVVYTQSAPLFMGRGGPSLWAPLGMLRYRNWLSAFALEDGKLLWRSEVPRMATNGVAVGRLYGSKELAVVQPAGMQTVQGMPTDVFAFEASTGKLRWTFVGPRQKDGMQQGDLQGLQTRQRLYPKRPLCLPNPWSSPTIDAAGTAFVGNQDGIFVGLRDVNGDGVVEGPEEVQLYDTVGTFAGASSPAMAPGLLAVANCDSLYAWLEPSSTEQ